MPENGVGRGAAKQTFRTREAEDPVEIVALTDAGNSIDLVHPLIGATSAAVRPSALVTELGDPAVLGGPIAFTIPKGQRLASSAIDIALAGAVASGLSTGDIAIELIADGGGRIYRNRYQPADTIPTNEEAPMMIDLSLDLAIYATDPAGNAVLAQTILGAQLTGVAFADEGKFAIETHGAIEINLLGITAAPANLVLDLINDADVAIVPDTQAPSLVTSLPVADSRDWIADEGIELVFDEPIDIARARGGGVKLHDGNGTMIPSLIESHGSVVVIRPRTMLADQRDYHVELADVADSSGNAMMPRSFVVRTETLAPTDVPASVVAIQPGTACALVGANPTTAGRCAGGGAGDDTYKPFALPANERIAVIFSQRLRTTSVTLGTTCNTGSVRVERVNAQGACVDTVIGTLSRKQRELAFVPDKPWTEGERYRLRLISGPNVTCEANEVCGANGRAASFDPLAGTAAAGGPDLIADFVGAAASEATTLFASTSPRSDLNASGHMDQGEQLRDENRVALQITGVSGLITFANFTGADCIPSTPVADACMYMLGAIPAQLGARRDNCTLPDGSTAATCVPVAMSAQTMYSTSMAMTAGALGIGIPTETGMTVMRVRENRERPLEGFIIEREGKPVMVVALDLYMDAPDMSLPSAQHDMHSKSLSVALEGPVTFRTDGRIALSLQNLADVPIVININAPLGIQGTVQLVVPKGGMQLQLLSAPQRGSLP
jgi:Bacterial Ig-like domain